MPIPTHKKQRIPVDMDVGRGVDRLDPQHKGAKGGPATHMRHRMDKEESTNPASNLNPSPPSGSGGAALHFKHRLSNVENPTPRKAVNP